MHQGDMDNVRKEKRPGKNRDAALDLRDQVKTLVFHLLDNRCLPTVSRPETADSENPKGRRQSCHDEKFAKPHAPLPLSEWVKSTGVVPTARISKAILYYSWVV